jgi:hypothetical protein
MIEADRGTEARHYLQCASSMMAPENPTDLASMSKRHTAAHISLGRTFRLPETDKASGR